MAFNIILNTSLAQYSESVMAEMDIEDGMIRRLENNVPIEMVLTWSLENCYTNSKILHDVIIDKIQMRWRAK